MDALQELTAAGGSLDQFFTPALVEQARAYAVPLRYVGMAELAVMLIEFGLVFGLGLHVKLYDLADRLTDRIATPASVRSAFERVWNGPGFGTAVLFAALMELGWALVGLPARIYFDFIREHAQGLSQQTVSSFIWDTAKGQLVSFLGIASLVIGLYGLMRRLPRAWAPVLGTFCAAILLVSGALDPLRNAVFYTYQPLPDGPARQAIVETLQKGHVEFQNVVVEDMSHSTSKGDAFFAGQGPTRLIVVGDTMLGRYTPRELAAVVAHEMGHLSEPVWTPRIAAALVLLLVVLGLPRLLGLCARRGWFGIRNPFDVTGYVLLMFLLNLAPVFSDPLTNWRSRARETAADQFSLELTQDPQDFITMMSKLTAQNRGDPAPWGWWEAWHWDHPAPARRLAHALVFAREHHLPLQLPPPQDAVPIAQN